MPYCNSEDTFPIVKNETEIKTKGYSMGRGCCGMCLLGPFGLLCGALFTGSKVRADLSPGGDVKIAEDNI